MQFCRPVGQSRGCAATVLNLHMRSEKSAEIGDLVYWGSPQRSALFLGDGRTVNGLYRRNATNEKIRALKVVRNYTPLEAGPSARETVVVKASSPECPAYAWALSGRGGARPEREG